MVRKITTLSDTANIRDAIVYSINTIGEADGHVMAKNANFIETLFLLEDGRELSEFTAWSLLSESESVLIDTFELVCDELENLTGDLGGVRMSAGQVFQFQDALQVVFYICVIRKIPTDDVVIRFCHLLRRYLACCDLSYEYSQSMLIEWLYPDIYRANADLAKELVLFYMLSGQCNYDNFSFLNRYFGGAHKPGTLKKLVDTLILGETDVYKRARVKVLIYYNLCALFYGNDNQARDDVIEYVKSRLEEPLRFPMNNRSYESIRRISREMEAFYADDVEWERRCDDTGFHKYSREKNKWIRI